jgi:hypothetical protein
MEKFLAEPNPARTRRKALGLGNLGTQLGEFNKKMLTKCLIRVLGRIYSRWSCLYKKFPIPSKKKDKGYPIT